MIATGGSAELVAGGTRLIDRVDPMLTFVGLKIIHALTDNSPGQGPGVRGAAGDEAGAELDDHAYFQAIEEIFVRLRGAPLLLSPADWQVAREWHRCGIPLDLVRRSLEELFERRRERGDERKVRSLRYCAEAVEEAWREVEEMTAPGRRRPSAPPLDVPDRLAALAAALPEGLPDGDHLRREITALEGSAEEVEDRLEALDAALLQSLEERVDPPVEREVEETVERALGGLADRLPPDELAVARRRLRGRELRRRAGAPVLSLFSPEARGGEEG